MKCVSRRMGDQYQCGKCGLQWDVKDEDRPKCSDKPRGVTGGPGVNQKASRETARNGRGGHLYGAPAWVSRPGES